MGFGTSPSLIAYDDVMIENLRINTLQLKKRMQIWSLFWMENLTALHPMKLILILDLPKSRGKFGLARRLENID